MERKERKAMESEADMEIETEKLTGRDGECERESERDAQRARRKRETDRE